MRTATVRYTKNIRNEKGEIISSVKGAVQYNFPSSIQEAVDMHGENVVLSIYNAALEVKIQNICRSADSVQEAQDIISKWVPGVSRKGTGVSKKDLFKALENLSDADRAELLAKLKGIS